MGGRYFADGRVSLFLAKRKAIEEEEI